jgi:flagellar basal-body rod protein FlgG
MRALSTAATGMHAQQTNVDVIANNIANMNTTGFKRARAEFSDLLYQSQTRVGSPTADAQTLSPAGVQIGLGVKTAGISRIYTQGSLVRTDNKLDLAIQGRGWFMVNAPGIEDPVYTRSGAFSLSADGTIVTAQGYPVSPGIVVPTNATDITVTKTGEVYVTLPGGVAPELAGQFDMAVFPNDNGLDGLGENLFTQTAASGEPTQTVAGDANVGMGSLTQGFVEQSNVNTVEEITNLIAAQRAYEMNSKVITTADEMMQTATNTR